MLTRNTVLFVEDDPDDRMIVSTAFTRSASNIHLRTAIDGEAAIQYLSGQGIYRNRDQHPLPQLVLLDLKLPRKSGFEVLEWIRAHPSLSQLPVIVLTSSQEQKDLERADALGVNSYLVKVVDVKLMREIVRGIGEYAALVGKKPGSPDSPKDPFLAPGGVEPGESDSRP
jgi:CheY-like chemotaxis protein